MKKTLITFVAICLGGFYTNAQSDCSKFYPFSEGAKSQLTMYNAKGKSQGMVEYHVSGIESKDGGTAATMTMNLIDKKGNELKGSNYELLCKDGIVSMDFKSLMRPGMLDAYGEIDHEITGTNLDFPNKLSVGQDLPDAEILIKLSMSGMNMNMSTLITDRKVLDKESVTTPAGTFECYVISQNTQIKSMASNMKRSSKQWIAEGVGVVKSEDYNKKGKLDTYSILTSFTK
ncbi:MAG: hypothetical protein KJO05_07175 [Bacteroidia bacterium]|nr:hypothetical protein [Bacteroidia bacterium]NNF32351.1 hypothetical protein [Flavobacteriaceae bacterium]MBT8276335.1 hypothetical protein [Bacteroidia bacterium]NNJ81396.1 hypothetical protein [Flavobacteriaceae bacterium]NNK53227.1 hypothetical protein [Flavobacteriaceae bacterium]